MSEKKENTDHNVLYLFLDYWLCPTISPKSQNIQFIIKETQKGADGTLFATFCERQHENIYTTVIEFLMISDAHWHSGVSP